MDDNHPPDGRFAASNLLSVNISFSQIPQITSQIFSTHSGNAFGTLKLMTETN
jgi:hypothetical protein